MHGITKCEIVFLFGIKYFQARIRSPWYTKKIDIFNYNLYLYKSFLKTRPNRSPQYISPICHSQIKLYFNHVLFKSPGFRKWILRKHLGQIFLKISQFLYPGMISINTLCFFPLLISCKTLPKSIFFWALD